MRTPAITISFQGPNQRNGPSAGGGRAEAIYWGCPWAGRAILAATRRLADIRSRQNWRTARLIPRDDHDRDDKQGCDQRKRAIQRFRAGCGAGVEWRHDTTLPAFTSLGACPVWRGPIHGCLRHDGEGQLFSAPGFAAVPAVTRALLRGHPPPEQSDYGCRTKAASAVSALCPFSCRRLQFAGQPAVHLRLHRILRHADCMNVTALLALESAVIETIRSSCDFGKQHTGFALRATRPLDVGKMRRSYGLILGHRISLHAAGALPNALSPITARRAR
jgi:hypothetical protein